MSSACDKMRSHNIRHLPVLDKNDQVIGLFTDTDLNRAYSPRKTEEGWYYDKNELDRLILEYWITKEPATLDPEATLQEAAHIMSRLKSGCIIIVSPKTNKLEGIITYMDILRQVAKEDPITKDEEIK